MATLGIPNICGANTNLGDVLNHDASGSSTVSVGD
jgi:hypothetical protein